MVKIGKDRIANEVLAAGMGLIASAAAQAKNKPANPTTKMDAPTIAALTLRRDIGVDITSKTARQAVITELMGFHGTLALFTKLAATKNTSFRSGTSHL